MAEFVAHEHWSTTCREHSEGAQNLFFGEFRMVATELLEHGCEKFVLGIGECCEDTFVESLNSVFVDHAIVWERHRFNGLPRGAFETLQDTSATGVHKENGFPTATGSACASDPMHVGFAIPRQIIVDHVRNAADVESAGGNIGGHDNADLTGFELFDDAFTLCLGHFAVERCSAVAVLAEQLSERLCGAAEFDENDGGVVGLSFEQAEECRFFLFGSCDHIPLPNGFSRSCSLLDFNIHRIPQLLLSNLADAFRHRGGEECCLPCRRESFKDPVNAFRKAHAEHFIGFVKDKATEGLEFERTSIHVIHDASGRPHNHVHATIEQTELRPHGSSAINCRHLQPRQTRRISFEGCCGLQCELASGDHYQHLRTTHRNINVVQQWQRKGRCFAGTRLSLSEQIATGKEVRDRASLNRRRGGIAGDADGGKE